MAVSSPAVIAAYGAGAGTAAATSLDLWAGVLALLALIWAAWAISGLLESFMDGALGHGHLLRYGLRAVLLLIVSLVLLAT